MRVFVAIVMFKSDPAALLWTLEGLRRQTLVPRSLRILINGSTIHDHELVEAGCRAYVSMRTNWRVISRPDNLGFTGGHNYLAQKFLDSDDDLLLVLNPDVHLDDNCIARLASAAHETGHLTGPVLYRAERVSTVNNGETFTPSKQIDTAGIYWTRDARHLDTAVLPNSAVEPPTYSVSALSGASMMARRSSVATITREDGELFDNAFFAYREDAELGIRANWYGIDSVVVPTAFGWHVRTLRGTSRAVSRKINLLGVQNRFLLAAKWGRHRPGSLLRSVARDVIVVLAALTVERSSMEGLARAYRVRRYERYRGRRIRAVQSEMGAVDRRSRS